jgi:hypothetical protein
MAIAALITWIVTALGGFTLLSLWLRSGGLSQQESKTTSFRSGVIFGHFLFAAAGLVLWIVYVVTDTGSLSWLSLAVLVVVALLGFAMFYRWLGVRRTAVMAASAPAERSLPVPVVALHGVLAVATVVLVLLAALSG